MYKLQKRRYPKKGKTQTRVGFILPFLLILLFASSCATTWEGRKHPEKRYPKTTRKQEAPVDKDILRPSEVEQYASIQSPARRSSMNMVVKGKALFKSGEYNEALGLFQEAVVIDSNNGIAYYYMAKTQFAMDQHEEALGILEKAEALLENVDEWNEAIALLRDQITAAYRRDSGLLPNEPEYY